MSSVFKREKSGKNIPQSSSAATAAPVASEVEQQQWQSEVPPTELAREEVATQGAAQKPARAGSIRQEHPTEEPAAA
jgi:hypothetical protein